jgi:hypothetical protein
VESLSLGPCAPFSLRSESESFAYILGAFLAHTEVGTKAGKQVSFASEDRESLKIVAHHLRACFDHSPEINPIRIDGKDLHRLIVCSPSLSRHLHTVTTDNRNVPWEHLETEKEQRAFLRAVFDQAGWISCGSSPGIGINKTRGYDLLRDVARVAMNVGIYPLLSDAPLATLRFRERRDWLVFESTIGASFCKDADKLSDLCDMRATKRSFEIEQYQGALRLARETSLSYSEIAKAIDVPVCSVRDWVKGRGTPAIVKRALALEPQVADLPDHRVITLLYRHLRTTSEVARQCAKFLTATEVSLRIERDQKGFSAVRGNSAAIAKLLGI